MFQSKNISLYIRFLKFNVHSVCFRGKLYEVVAEWKQTKITPPTPPRRRPPARRAKKRKYKIPNKVEIAKLTKTVSEKIPDISHSSLRERANDVLSIIYPRKNTTTLQFIRKRPIQPAKVTEAKKRRKKCEEILVKQKSVFTDNDDTSLVEMDYIADSGKNLNRGSGSGVNISLENIAECRVAKDGLAIGPLRKIDPREGFIQCRVPCPVTMNPTRKWTIEEDRKILYIHKENGTDLDLTLASVQLELPEIPVDELRQRLAFLLSLLQRMEDTGSK